MAWYRSQPIQRLTVGRRRHSSRRAVLTRCESISIISHWAALLEIRGPLLSRARSRMVIHPAVRRRCRAHWWTLQSQRRSDTLLVARHHDIVRECTQGFVNRLQPLVMCEYDVDCDGIVDLRDDAARRIQGVDRGDLACSCLTFQLAGKDARSWLMVDMLKSAGNSGMLVPSFVPGATDANVNLVLWRWGPELPHEIDVYDPTGRLPQNQLSWPALAFEKTQTTS